jgi:hypothetical protein
MSIRDSRRRTKQVEMGLTPKQKVILWQKNLPRFEGGWDYNQWVLDQCAQTGSHPSTRLKDEAEFDIHRAMVHERPGAIEQAVTQGRQQVDFLIGLYERVNEYALREQVAVHEIQELLGLLRNNSRRARILYPLQRLFCFLHSRIPYPLDKPTAAAVEAAVGNCVVPLHQLDSTCINRWVGDHFVSQGKQEIPPTVRSFVANYVEPGDPEDEHLKEILTLSFHDKEALTDFLTGKDCHYGVADVRDCEWQRVRDGISEELDDLVEAGALKTSSVVRLPTVPMTFLKEAPLIDDTWVDELVVVLAEEGALLGQNGFDPVPYEAHPLAWHRIVSGNSGEAAAEQVRATRQAARENLARFRGRRKEIGGRPYIHFGDFSCWKGRKLKDDLDSEDFRRKGIVVRSWNKMVEEQGGEGEAELGGIKVRKIERFQIADLGHVTFEDPVVAAEEQALRKQVFIEKRDWVEGGSPGKEVKRLRAMLWEALFEEFYPFAYDRIESEFAQQRKVATSGKGKLIRIKEVVERISQRYFDGQLVPWRVVISGVDCFFRFDGIKQSNDRMVAEVIRSTGAPGVPLPEPLDSEDVMRQAIDSQVEKDVARLVAGSEADALIARGRYEEARRILEPYSK